MRELGPIENLFDRMRKTVTELDNHSIEYIFDADGNLDTQDTIIKALEFKLAWSDVLVSLLEETTVRYRCLLATSDLDYLTTQLDKINDVESFWSGVIKERIKMYQEVIDHAKRTAAKTQLVEAI